jgi:hypothetical protein
MRSQRYRWVSLLGCIAAATGFTCGGRVAVDPVPGPGGQGPEGATAGPSETSATAGTSSTTSATVGDGAGGGARCQRCGPFLQNGIGDPDILCPGSEKLYSAVLFCLCRQQCAIPCVDACTGGDVQSACQICIMNQCGDEMRACFQDT